jgi:hypothetical protein
VKARAATTELFRWELRGQLFRLTLVNDLPRIETLPPNPTAPWTMLELTPDLEAATAGILRALRGPETPLALIPDPHTAVLPTPAAFGSLRSGDGPG